MGRPKLGAEYRKYGDYNYDYPKNREIGKHIMIEDKKYIAKRTGFSYTYVNDFCIGKRYNRRIEDVARQVMRLNIAKQRKLNSQPNTSTN
ncbi:MAG: hypothetical protein NT004_10090 [Bacteroidetes bacterium]|nr:hypothetical protein [Bacteroidota bacterium]